MDNQRQVELKTLIKLKDNENHIFTSKLFCCCYLVFYILLLGNMCIAVKNCYGRWLEGVGGLRDRLTLVIANQYLFVTKY